MASCSRIYKVGILHERVTKNPVLPVETRCNTNYRAIVITPTQTFNILKSLTNPLHHTLVLTCAATALRSSEILALRWADILWHEERIRVSKRWVKGRMVKPRRKHPTVTSPCIQSWRIIYGDGAARRPTQKDEDFVFPSLKAHGRVPLSSSVFVADHLRPAAKAAGVLIQDGQRFGLHNLRHSLCNWLVNKAKVEPKTVQGILRHSRIQTTLDLYTQEDSDEARASAGQVPESSRSIGNGAMNVLWVELWVGDFSGCASNLLKDMVGPWGLEPQTSTVSR